VLVDVMLPAYGDGSLVREAIASVRNQRDPGWRLTVIDDGVTTSSGDGLEAWLAGLGDSRIRYLANAARLGINRNFQRCADEATDEWVVIMGGDDRLLPHFVAEVHDVAASFPGAAWIHTGATIIGADGQPLRPLVDRVKRLTAPRVRGRRVMGGEDLAVSLLRGNWMYFPSIAFRRTELQRHGFRPGYDLVLDLDLYLRLLRHGGDAVLLEQPGIEYRRHPAGLSSARADDGSRFDEETAFFAETFASMRAAGWPRAARAANLHWTSRLHALCKVPGLLAAGNRRTAGSMLHRALAVTRREPATRVGAR